MDGSTARKPTKPFDDLGGGFEDLNWVECPMAVLSKNPPKDVKTLRFKDTIFDSSAKADIERRWTISAVEALSLPTYIDHNVLLALKRHTREVTNFAQGPVPFTLYRICQLLRWPTDDGRYCKMVKSALRKWSGTWIQFENSFRRGGRWTTERGFTVISYYELTRGEDFDEDEPQKEQTLIWNPKFVESMRSASKKINWDLYLGLNPTAQRLYRLLDKRFYGTDFYKPRLGLVDFCTEKIGMTRNYTKPVKYRQKLQPAIDELVDCRFLASVKFEGRGRDTKLLFRKSKRDVVVPVSAGLTVLKAEKATTNSDKKKENQQKSLWDETEPTWVKRLRELRVSPDEFSSAQDIHDFNRVVEYLDHQVRERKGSAKPVKNVPAYYASFFRKVIAGGAAVPDEFKTNKERSEIKKALAELNRWKNQLASRQSEVSKRHRAIPMESFQSLAADVQEQLKIEAISSLNKSGKEPSGGMVRSWLEQRFKHHQKMNKLGHEVPECVQLWFSNASEHWARFKAEPGGAWSFYDAVSKKVQAATVTLEQLRGYPEKRAIDGESSSSREDESESPMVSKPPPHAA